jgi:hypothetical protein
MKHHARSLLSACVLAGTLGLASEAFASPTLGWGGTTSGDPSVIYYNDGTGWTPNGKVLVGTWDGYTNTWTAYKYVYADSNGNLTNGSFDADCADTDNQWLLGYDDTTGDTGGYWYVNSDCTD